VPEEDEISIKDVVGMVADAFEFDRANIVHDTTKSDGQYKKTACNDKLKKLYPDFAFTSMRDGVQASVDWFIANHETARK
jgi:GDP-L-fucose synthase